MARRAGGSTVTRPEIWVSVTCTDRAGSLRALAIDLVEQAAQTGAALTLLINDNSTQRDARAGNRQLTDVLARSEAAAVAVVIEDAPHPGAGIASSRRQQRAQIRARLAQHPRPELVWMLDDDVRLGHVAWTGAWLEERPLHCHLAFLLQLAATHPTLDVLIGEVCGDAPIPVVGSIAGRLADLEASLHAMFGAPPDAPWCAPAIALERLGARDAYYDLSTVRAAGAWQREVLWLPRGGHMTTAQALAQMLAEVEHVPRGAAFSRPILAEAVRFGALTDRPPPRGANAVFFDVERCLQHAYPSLTIAGIETRRGDMIGTELLAGAGATVRGSGFSVLHRRPRTAPWPTRDALADSLVADTLGAWLARRLDPHVASAERAAFLRERLARLHEVARYVAEVSGRLRRLATEAPPWAPALDAMLAVVDWALTCVPGARDGRLPRELVETMRVVEERDDLATAARLADGAAT
ncbi:MAG TPA: hypothetical protein VH165_07450 [Kofleriaceae bacterium]|nr:hypothetical protein [Kofleriaceae bacterium]